MEKYYDLEENILCCFLLEPKLMEETILEDKHFIKYQRLWQFMKTFYERFKCFDLVLMASCCKDNWKLMQYIMTIIDILPTTSNFKKYENELIYLYNETKKEKWITHKIMIETNKLQVRSITTTDFKKRIEDIYNNADKIFKKGDEENE